MNNEKARKNHTGDFEFTTAVKNLLPKSRDATGNYTEENFYSREELGLAPAIARKLACGCANPLSFVALSPNQSVVDLGCGIGLDVILAANKVGQGGRTFGIDIDRTIINQAKAAAPKSRLPAGSIKFYEADIESSKLPKSYADIVISNCTINLCPKKDIVLKNIYRVLRPGATFILSDIVFAGESEQMLQSTQTFWQNREAQIKPKEYYLNLLNSLSFTEITISKYCMISQGMMESLGYSTKSRKKALQNNKDTFIIKENFAAITLTAKRPPLNC